MDGISYELALPRLYDEEFLFIEKYTKVMKPLQRRSTFYKGKSTRIWELFYP